jgi:CDGSH-type Zn-finger protein
MPDKPTIEPIANGPNHVRNLKEFKNSRGEPVEVKSEMYLCRCGGSSNKPYCDGTHRENGFNSQRSPDRVPDKVDDYIGQELTIHDNRGVCAHSGLCTDNSPSIFKLRQEPWIDPNAASTDEAAKTINTCPSGALSYTKDGILHKNQDRDPAIHISKNGPHRIVGGIKLNDPTDSKPEADEHYSLCRCGGSKNKPFCSGAHWGIEFKDERN